jgi:hypothetical protein
MKSPLLLLALLVPTLLAAAELRVERVPENGLQPDALTDGSGRTHLIYLTGDPKFSDIQCVTRPSPSEPWSRPIRVNSQPGSAVAIGTVRGARLTLASSNRVCVVWNGSSQHRGGLGWSERDRLSPTWTPVERRPGVPVWGSPTAVCESDGRFTVWY